MHRRHMIVTLVCFTAMTACSLVQLEPIQSLDPSGPRVPLHAAYWVSPQLRRVDRLFFPFMEGAGCGVGRTCVDDRRIFPDGVAAVARAVFEDSKEVATLDAGFDDPAVDVVMASELNAIQAQDFARPLMIRIVWRIWAKDRSVLWLDTITSTVSPDGLTRNPRARAFNRCARDQFQQAANAMRAGRWWETPAVREKNRPDR